MSDRDEITVVKSLLLSYSATQLIHGITEDSGQGAEQDKVLPTAPVPTRTRTRTAKSLLSVSNLSKGQML